MLQVFYNYALPLFSSNTNSVNNNNNSVNSNSVSAISTEGIMLPKSPKDVSLSAIHKANDDLHYHSTKDNSVDSKDDLSQEQLLFAELPYDLPELLPQMDSKTQLTSVTESEEDELAFGLIGLFDESNVLDTIPNPQPPIDLSHLQTQQYAWDDENEIVTHINNYEDNYGDNYVENHVENHEDDYVGDYEDDVHYDHDPHSSGGQGDFKKGTGYGHDSAQLWNFSEFLTNKDLKTVSTVSMLQALQSELMNYSNNGDENSIVLSLTELYALFPSFTQLTNVITEYLVTDSVLELEKNKDVVLIVLQLLQTLLVYKTAFSELLVEEILGKVTLYSTIKVLLQRLEQYQKRLAPSTISIVESSNNDVTINTTATATTTVTDLGVNKIDVTVVKKYPTSELLVPTQYKTNQKQFSSEVMENILKKIQDVQYVSAIATGAMTTSLITNVKVVEPEVEEIDSLPEIIKLATVIVQEFDTRHSNSILVKDTVMTDSMDSISCMKDSAEITNEQLATIYMETMQQLQYGEVDGLGDYYYLPNLKNISVTGGNKKRIRRLVQEHSDISHSLPLSLSSSVWLRVAEERIDTLKFMISGPDDTPYGNGLFIFDCLLDNDYPTVPPKVNLATTGRNSVRFNPNLYNCGKVCLSLLNTWSGKKPLQLQI